MTTDLQIAGFNYNNIRSAVHEGVRYFSVIDFIQALTESPHPKKYWEKLKVREFQTSPNWGRLKLLSNDGKMRLTDVATVEQLLRILQSVPSPKAEPAKAWLARVGNERVEETANPELGIKRSRQRAIAQWRKQGRSEEWIKARLEGITYRHSYTDALKELGVTDPKDYARYTSRTHQSALGVTPSEHKEIKRLEKKDNLRDNMTRIEVMFLSNAELIISEDVRKGTKLDTAIPKYGAFAAIMREQYEKTYGTPVVSEKRAETVQIEEDDHPLRGLLEAIQRK